EYPLVLNVFRPTVFYGGRTANMPYLLEIAGKNRQVGWESWIEIHRGTASLYGISDRDMVWVESPLGKIKVRARVDPGTNPEVVSLPFGLGHEVGGRWAKGLGANPNKLVGIATMAVTGASAYSVTRVKVYRA
ncbi:MAG: molybdopterin dinucleotide binding domain-containing protein, partial [Deltaproteobacteria bacterium]|nr:molybdopterin dinucleotide binding domain-containing protein [Deltaproteobacteria bacterium]